MGGVVIFRNSRNGINYVIIFILFMMVERIFSVMVICYLGKWVSSVEIISVFWNILFVLLVM